MTTPLDRLVTDVPLYVNRSADNLHHMPRKEYVDTIIKVVAVASVVGLFFGSLAFVIAGVIALAYFSYEANPFPSPPDNIPQMVQSVLSPPQRAASSSFRQRSDATATVNQVLREVRRADPAAANQIENVLDVGRRDPLLAPLLQNISSENRFRRWVRSVRNSLLTDS